ncbi:hypothetical protein ZIOFF_028114 [Zingiber officinale]|uniref:Uncharacterized protein n=1 Tax=Zingiber officinale TaxID=94328 RepID=A0A8J5GUH8_ZINOF|nr:hypothetical protein ZIOFF_028114 [Zingiber officinale]
MIGCESAVDSSDEILRKEEEIDLGKLGLGVEKVGAVPCGGGARAQATGSGPGCRRSARERKRASGFGRKRSAQSRVGVGVQLQRGKGPRHCCVDSSDEILGKEEEIGLGKLGFGVEKVGAVPCDGGAVPCDGGAREQATGSGSGEHEPEAEGARFLSRLYCNKALDPVTLTFSA